MRSDVLRVGSIDDLFCMAEVLAKQPRPTGPRLAIVTNAGGPGVLATDALMTSGGELAPLADTMLASLDQLLPPPWSHGNPIDILGDADPDRYVKALEIAVRDHQGLSDRSVYFRYFSMINLSHRVAHERLARNCFIDYDCQMALVAERKGRTRS